MLLLHIINGKQAGTQFTARQFPVRVGRSASADLVLEEPGVWDEHFQIDFTPEGLMLASQPEAPVLINDQPVSEARLRNGDIISIGQLSLRFELAPVLQRNQAVSEWILWAGLATVYCAQAVLICWLLKYY